MNLMEQLKPKASNAHLNYTEKPAPAIKEFDLDEKVKTFTELDTMNVVSVPEEKSLIPNTYNLFDISSYCNEHVRFTLEMNELDEKYKKKFTDEISYITYINNKRNNKILNNYLANRYGELQFEIDVPVLLNIDTVQITVKDSLYFTDDTFYVPASYKYLMTDLMNNLKVKKNVMLVQDTGIVPIGNFPLRRITDDKFYIKQTNPLYCGSCMFNAICDQKK